MPALPEIIGMPPMDTNDLTGLDGVSPADCYKNSSFTECVMPRLRLYPAIPKFQAGLEFFQVNQAEGMTKFRKHLKDNGDFSVNKNYLEIAYQNISPFTETYGNDFSQSTLVTALSPLSEGAREIAYITGSNLSKFGSQVESAQKILAQKTGEKTDARARQDAVRASAAGRVAALATGAESMLGSVVGQRGAQSAMRLAKNLATGGKLNFPMVWKSTSFDRQYDFTVRLYNLNPRNPELQDHLIIGPMVALLAFVVPFSDDGNTYKWPLICKLQIPGQVKIEAAYIRTMSVIRGGDANDQSWDNRPGIVDIKFTVADLYSTMVNSPEGKGNRHTPTVKQMVDYMREYQSDECCDVNPGGLRTARTTESTAPLKTLEDIQTDNEAKQRRAAQEDALAGESTLINNPQEEAVA